MDAGRGPHPTEVEAERGQAQTLGNLAHADHHGIVHIPAVEGVGVTDHEAGAGRLRQRQQGFQSGTVLNVNLYRGFHYMTLVR
jgi:hypothetical protein